MANTFIPIGTTTVGSGGASSISFTSIPQTYTDLKLVFSIRATRPGTTTDILNVSFNGSSTNESCMRIESDASNSSSTANSLMLVYNANGTGATANVFGNGELYISNYTSSNFKYAFSDGVAENNGTTAYMGMSANLWSDTAAITSVTLTPDAATDFVQYSSATLYGIKKN